MPDLRLATTAADHALFEQLLREYAARDLADAHTSSIWADLKDLPGRYAAPGGGIVLARWDHQLAGCGAFAPTRIDGVTEIKRLYVRTPFRHHGIARALSTRLLSSATHAGYRQAAISTWNDNHPALALYQQLGFVPTAPFKDHPNPRLVYLAVKLRHGAAPTPP